MNTHHSLNYIEFGATDLEATKAFYSAVFQWRFTDYGPAYVSFIDPAERTGGFDLSLAPGKSPLVVLYSSSLEETQARIEASGGKITTHTFSFPGGRRFHFTDPNGNELAVWSE